MTEQKPTSLYAVFFDDGRIKVGISHQVRRRMTYYRQEARRNRREWITWYACKPFQDKKTALIAERILCRTFKEFAFKGHREWFSFQAGGLEEIVGFMEQVRIALAHEVGQEKEEIPYYGGAGTWRVAA